MHQTVCVRRIYKKPICRRTQNNHEIHISSAIAITSTRRPSKLVPRVNKCSPASTRPGLEETGLLQLAQSELTANITHTHRQRQADRQADRQAGRQADRQTGRKTRQTDRQTDRQSARMYR